MEGKENKRKEKKERKERKEREEKEGERRTKGRNEWKEKGRKGRIPIQKELQGRKGMEMEWKEAKEGRVKGSTSPFHFVNVTL